MTTSRRYLAVVLCLGLLATAGPAHAQEAGATRLKDMVVLKGAKPVQLTGYGLVVGLDRTGDRARGRRGAPYTVQSVANMLKRFGITIDPNDLSSRNTAAVMVTATMDPFAGPGSQLDVTISSLGDARSLSGGVLLQTPLLDASKGGNKMYALAQGPLVTGSAAASSSGSSVQVNHPNTGRIPNGALIQRSPPIDIDGNTVDLVLERPDFTNAKKVAEAINGVFGDAAAAKHAGLVTVQMPSALNNASQLMAALEGVTVNVDLPAKVVVNERTGTIVAGGNVRINKVMVTYGNLVISTQKKKFVSQPNALGQGQTVQGAQGQAEVKQDGARSVVLPPNTNVNELASALNDLGLTARDVISIFQSIDRAGALQGKLVIL